ncbi:MAG: hypothetical protein COB59_12225 [Rhodospirillaceae bacterium]|nr:MAG: hypothetical protein COB59_12225 [Rhodospirillaceae bacterium]
MFGNDVRLKLKMACRLLGGQKSVANSAHIDNSNFGKWLKGQPTLSEENIQAVLTAMGLPDGEPDTKNIHCWNIKNSFLNNLSSALSLYFPYTAEMARAPWVVQGPSLKDTLGIGDAPNTLYALTDGKTRAILRMPRSVIIQENNVLPVIKWRNDTPEKSVLLIEEIKSGWVTGVPTVKEFDLAWNAQGHQVTDHDVLQAIKDADISNKEAVRRIKQKK